MEPVKLESRDIRLLFILAVVFIVSIAIGVVGFPKAMPEASVDFKVTRTESRDIALGWLDSLGYTLPEGYRHAAIFGYDNNAKVYLEKELGLDKAQEFFGDPVRLWAWRNRWFLPGEKEEFRVYVSPEGEVIAAEHSVEETAEGASLERAEALSVAQLFLAEKLGIDTTTVTLHDGMREALPNRADWTFTWEVKDFEPVEGSSYRYAVTLHGDVVSGHREYLHVPERWQADYTKLRSYNQLAGGVASLFLLLTIVAIFVVFIQKLRARDIRWKTALIFGIVAAALVYANSLNSLPNSLYGYDTTTSWSGFLMQEIIVGLLSAVGVGVMITLLTASAEAMFRERHPSLPSLPAMFTLRGLRTKRAFINIVLGVTMTAFFFAYQVVFYLVADRFGGWSPADVPYDNLLNTAMPWLAVLMIGFMPAVSEEFISRMFSIPFLQKMFKNRYTWLAVLIPAFIWGFGHAGYPNQPFWIRGVEVGIAGVIVGAIFLRFGILAPLVWHYTVDALYTAFLLLGSGNIYFVLTASVGAGLLIIPLAAALIAYLKTGTFLPESGMSNADIPPPQLKASDEELEASETATKPPSAESALVSTEPDTSLDAGKGRLPWTVRIAAVVILLAGLFAKPPERIGDFIRFDVTAQEALATFSDSLRSVGWANPDTMTIRAFLGGGNGGPASDETYALKYLGSVSDFNARYDTLLGVGRWTLRAWTPENRLRFWGLVHGRTGEIVRMETLLPEEMAGDSMSQDDARLLVEETFERVGISLENLTLADQTELKRPARVDHQFIYETEDNDPRNLGEERLRYTGSVHGSYVAVGINPTSKIPESWQRDRQASTGTRTAWRIMIILLRAALIGYVATILFLKTRQGTAPWKKALVYAGIASVIYLLNLPGMLHQIEGAYFFSPEIPWNVFVGSGAISVIVSTLAIFGLTLFLIVSAGAMHNQSSKTLLSTGNDRSVIDLTATVVAGIGAVLLAGSARGWLEFLAPSAAQFSGWGVPDGLDASLAALTLTGDSILPAAVLASFAALAGHLWKGPMKTPLLKALLVFVLVLALVDLDARGLNEIMLSVALNVVRVLLVWVILKFFVAGDGVRLVIAAWLAAAIPSLFEAAGMFPWATVSVILSGVLVLALPAAWIATASKESGV